MGTPHEVLPNSGADRYALSCWYVDKDELPTDAKVTLMAARAAESVKLSPHTEERRERKSPRRMSNMQHAISDRTISTTGTTTPATASTITTTATGTTAW